MEKFKKLNRAEMKMVLGGDYPNPCKQFTCGDINNPSDCSKKPGCGCVYEANPPFYGDVCVPAVA
ncbi:hypothetical protein SAMN05216524_104559 [Mucilaginibacter sp. OK098]|nr:hypothetical protein SAMN05216524_104559 [Mucilaginibacter sp. OK098]